MILDKFPFIGASADGIYIYEKRLVRDKFKAQIMLQMLLWKKNKGFFCIADPKFEENKVVTIVPVQYDETFLMPLIEAASEFWKNFIFKKLIHTVL